MKYKNTLLCLLTVATLPTLALAKPEKQGKKGEAFGRIDTNGDQVITLNEAQNAGAQRIVENFTTIDADGSGELTKEELRNHAQQRMEERRARRQTMDADGNGAISRDEAANAGAERLVEHFDTIDGNGDGEIDRQEMKELRKVMREQRMQKKQS